MRKREEEKKNKQAMEPVARSMLYAFGPFYCNPAKPVLNLVFGDGYDVGYKHFRRDHSVRACASSLIYTFVEFTLFDIFAVIYNCAVTSTS